VKIGDFGLATKLQFIRHANSISSSSSSSSLSHNESLLELTATSKSNRRSLQKGEEVGSKLTAQRNDSRGGYVTTIGGTPCYQPPELFGAVEDEVEEEDQEIDSSSDSDSSDSSGTESEEDGNNGNDNEDEDEDNGIDEKRSSDEMSCSSKENPLGPDVEMNMRAGPPIDVWGLGCVLFEAVPHCSIPFEEPYFGEIALQLNAWNEKLNMIQKQFKKGLNKMIKAELDGKQQQKQSSHTRAAMLARMNSRRDWLVDLLGGLLARDPICRPSLRQIIQQSMFQNLMR